MTWKFDDAVAASFREHARCHIPGYERVIDKSVMLCERTLGSDAHVIDVGCAVGETLEKLHRCGFHNLAGVDSSQAMLDRIKPGIAQLHLNDRFPAVEQKYDAVLMNWTLHFIEDKHRYLDDIYENTKPGGFLVLSDKTSLNPVYIDMYHRFKLAQGVSMADIQAKVASLVGSMHINDQQWYRSALMAAGFVDMTIIDADWCFTTFLAWKPDA